MTIIWNHLYCESYLQLIQKIIFPNQDLKIFQELVHLKKKMNWTCEICNTRYKTNKRGLHTTIKTETQAIIMKVI